MAEYSREGHRSRIRQNYIANGTNGMSDANLLELYLSTIIPRKDVKPVSYELLNKFGDLQGVFSASVSELTKVNGIGENTAVVIKLYSDLVSRIEGLEADEKVVMTKKKQRLNFGKTAFLGENDEKSLLITVDNHDEISGTFMFDGYFCSKKEDKMALVEKLLQTNSSQCVLYHYVPNGKAVVTELDAKIVFDIREFLQPLHICIIDFVVVSKENVASILDNKEFRHYV